MGISRQQYDEMRRRVEKSGQSKKSSGAAERPVNLVPVSAPELPVSLVFTGDYEVKEFTFSGSPMGKPRMTRRDKFVKRPKAVRYWAFKDALRAAAGNVPDQPDVLMVYAWSPMPASWSEKKKVQMDGRPCRQRPDFDNIGKAVADALFDEDACIWAGTVTKYWCRAGQERLEVKILYYAKPQ